MTRSRFSKLWLHRPGLILVIAFGSVAWIQPQAFAQDSVPAATTQPATGNWGPITALGEEIAPGTKHKLLSLPQDDFFGARMAVPVWIARGVRPGPALAITGGIHGDELNGIEIARRIFFETDVKDLSGMLVVLPVLNRHGFIAGSRYMSDRRDMNRAFPGSPNGSSASIIADSVFERVICKADALIDLHTASDLRINLPQIRTDLTSPSALALAQHFGTGVVLDGKGPLGSLRRTALDAGVPAIIYEAGAAYVLQTKEIERGVTGIHNVMRYLKMIPTEDNADQPKAIVYKKTRWLRVPPGAAGMFLTSLQPGDEVKQGEELGKVIDPLSDKTFPVTSSESGVIIGMAVPTVVYTGDALFHLGLEKLE